MNLAQRVLQKINTTSNLYLITILFIITFLCYINTLGNGLFYDDEDFIYKNVYVQNFSVGDFFTKALTQGTEKLSNYYRPVLMITYGLEYKIFGNNGFIYHLNSLLIHIGVGTILFLLITKVFKNKALGFLTTLLFLIHPMQTEAVSYASGRGDPLALLFMLLCIYFSLLSKTKYKILSFFSLILALLSKELAIVTPLLLLVTHLVYKKSLTKKTFIEVLKFSFPYIAITLGYILLRLTVLNFANTLNFYNAQNIYSSNLFVRLNTFVNLLPLYFQLLMFPKTLFIDRPSVVFAGPTIITVIASLVIITGVFLSIKCYKQIPLFFFCLSWFFIAFIPTSGIIPINGIFYEHFIYIPSIAVFLLVSFCFMEVIKKAPAIVSLILFFVIFCSLFLLGIRTIARNQDWHDPITFYTQTLKYTESARIRNNFAMALAESGDNKKAIQEYQKAIIVSDTYAETHYNLGNAYVAINDLQNAEKEYIASVTINPYFLRGYIALARLYKATNQKEKLEKLAKTVETLSQKNPQLLDFNTQLQTYIKNSSL